MIDESLFIDYIISSIPKMIDGHFSFHFAPSGHNGPYIDLESPVRNTAHTLTSCSIVYSLTNDTKYKELCNKLFCYLADDCPFLIDGRYILRQSEGKDSCNGVIGPAWVAEAFYIYGHIFGNQEAIKKGDQIIDDCRFDSKKRLWYRSDPVLGMLSFDRTYNHQAYFAAVTSQSNVDKLNKHAKAFLDFSEDKAFSVNESGLINHTISSIRPDYRRDLVQKIFFKYHFHNAKKPYQLDIEKRDLGYHLYDLYALALLKNNIPDHSIWKSQKVKSSLDFVTKDFLVSLEDNKYAYPYNAPGFELPLISLAFQDTAPVLKDLVQPAFEKQVELTWNDSTKMFSRNTVDPFTLNARVYELALYLFYKNKVER